jgi:hypothetical protein
MAVVDATSGTVEGSWSPDDSVSPHKVWIVGDVLQGTMYCCRQSRGGEVGSY